MRCFFCKDRSNRACYLIVLLAVTFCLLYYRASLDSFSTILESTLGYVKNRNLSTLSYGDFEDSQSLSLFENSGMVKAQPEFKVEEIESGDSDARIYEQQKLLAEFKVDDDVDLDKKIKLFADEVRRRMSVVKSEMGYQPPNITCEPGKNPPLCFAENCPNAPYNLTAEERVRKLLTYPALSLGPDQLENILTLAKDIPEDDIIIATASSANHYNEMQALFKSFDKDVFPLVNASVVVFDLGLTKQQREEAEAKCRCQIYTFPFEKFPEHIKSLNCFAWKVMIIRALITKVRKVLIYQDTSVRWNAHLIEAITRASRVGQVSFSFKYEASTVYRTLHEMYKYFGEEACSYRSFRENLGGVQIMANDQLLTEAILNPWARCALEKTCICPRPIREVLMCGGLKPHGCHRSDQSAMSMLLGKLYGGDSYKLVPPAPIYPMQVRRGESDHNYFQHRKALR